MAQKGDLRVGEMTAHEKSVANGKKGAEVRAANKLQAQNAASGPKMARAEACHVGSDFRSLPATLESIANVRDRADEFLQWAGAELRQSAPSSFVAEPTLTTVKLTRPSVGHATTPGPSEKPRRGRKPGSRNKPKAGVASATAHGGASDAA